MKIHIWQQFASNHSNSFTVVGTFTSSEKAQSAATILQQLFDDIRAQRTAAEISTAPTQAELDAAAQFHISGWDKRLDWQEDVGVVSNHLFVRNMNETWQGTYVIADLIQKLGATVHSDAENDQTMLYADIQFVAPDEPTADQLYAELQTYFTLQENVCGSMLDDPWMLYAGGGRHPDAARIQYLERKRRLSKPLDQDCIKVFRELVSASHGSNKILYDYVRHILNDYLNNAPGEKLTPEEMAYLRRQKYSFLNLIPDVGGGVWRDGLSFEIKRVSNFELTHGQTLLALETWLTDQGCASIEITFYEGDWHHD